jgi:hypothetical protein
MIATERTQSLTDFRLKAAETLERLNQTGEAEIITVNGEARAVPRRTLRTGYWRAPARTTAANAPQAGPLNTACQQSRLIPFIRSAPSDE